MKTTKATRVWVQFLAIIPAVSAAAHAATISGKVTSGGRPVRGSLITVISPDKLMSETVYTDSTGRYVIDTKQSGVVSIRARAPLHADFLTNTNIASGDSKMLQAFELRRLSSAQEISDSLPASAHFSRIKFPTLIQRQQFQTDCMSCHELGNPLTRKARPLEAWRAYMGMMTVFCGYTTKIHVGDYAAALNAAFDGTPVSAHENTAMDAEALSARITEWKLPTAQLAHDTEFYPADGKFYTTDEFVDQLIVTDPKTNQSEIIPIPALGVLAGGNFTEHKLAAPFNQSNHHGVHSLQIGPDGLFYATGAIGGEILVFDPAHRTFKVNKIGGMALYPHTLRIDSQGIVWFSIQMSNQIGRFDPKTGKTTVIELPTKMARKDERTPAPYGVDVNPLDGSIWYTKLWANMIGRIDPKTLAVQEWEPPVVGPRRARFDKVGGLWIPGFGDGKIARLDTRTMKYEMYKLPTLAPDETEAPYALNVDPKTQDVWVSANQSDRMFRLSAKTKKFIAFPLPTRGVYFRDVIFTPDGRVCASNNPMPPQAEVVEGGMDSLICLEPDGNKHLSGPGAAKTSRPAGALTTALAR